MDRGQRNTKRRLGRALLGPLVATFVLLASAAAAQANTIAVTVTGDPSGSGDCLTSDTSCSLRQAVAVASSGDTIDLAGDTYSLTQGADIDIAASPLTIEGNGVSSTTIDGSQNTAGNTVGIARIFRIDGASVTFEGLTLTGGDDGVDENCPDGCQTLQENGGGAVFNNGGTLGFTNVAFTNDGGALGGAISTNGGSMSLSNVSFTGDEGYIGGALFVRGGNVTGNAVLFYQDATVATYNAAVYLYGGTVSFTNTTVADSGGASSRGGGIDNGGASLTLINDTLSGNIRGALLTDQSASTTVQNTIIGAGFSDGVDYGCIASGHTDDINDRTTANAITTDGGHNIDQDGHCGLTGSTDTSGQDPMLAPVFDNGGPTLTQALLAGSPALGDPATTNCPSTDERGQPRPTGKCDIGAFEAILKAAPDASTGNASNITDSSADLAATIDLGGEAGGFHFVYGTSPTQLTSSSPVLAAGVVSTATAETETLSNLNPATTYYYASVADNATASTTAPNVESFKTSPGPPVISSVSVASVSDTTATIDFAIDPQGADTNYVVEYGPDANYGQQTPMQPQDIGATPGVQNLSATITGLNPGSVYHFDVVATNEVQQVDGGDAEFATDRQIVGTAGTEITVTDSGAAFQCPSANDTTVDWGDGSSDTGAQIQCQEGPEDETDVTLTDTHTYGAPGHYLVQIEYGDLDSVTEEYADISANNPGITNTTPPAPNSPATSAPALPTVVTTAPTVSVTSAGFSGSVAPNGLSTQAYFQFALDPKYTGGGPLVYNQSTAPQNVGSDFSSHTVGPVPVSGLVPNALYHVRLVATNAEGTTFGPDVTFTTAAAAAPSAPRLGSTFNIAPVSGVVLIEINGRFVPLTGLDQIPSGSRIDARHGSLELITSTGVKGKTQHGTFGGAIFQLTQERSGKTKGLVTLTLLEGLFKGAPSYALCTRHKAGDASAAAASSKTLQLLHASAHGKFRTKGRYSAATVLGTKWTIADRCDGTLVHDLTDSVVVTDFLHHKSIILHAGQSYLARAHP